MANVVLVEPGETVASPKVLYRRVFLPTTVLTVAAPLLEEGYSVKIIDQRTTPDWQQQLLSAVDEDTICVGVTSRTARMLLSALAASRLVKESTDVPVVWGGIHASLLPEQTLANPYIDFVVQGEGEQTFLELLGALEKKKAQFDIKGLWYKQNGSIKANPPREFLDVNTLPRIPFHLVNMADYDLKSRFMMFSSKGCPHQCGFCYNIQYCDRRWRPMSAERVLEDLRFYVSEYGPRHIYFLDDNFFVDLERVRQICEGMIREGLSLSWQTMCRIDYVKRITDEDLELFRASGFRASRFGMESGSQRVLDIMQKDLTVEDILTATARLTKKGFSVRASFIGGYPGETEEDLDETIELIAALFKQDPRFSFNFNLLQPYPGTDASKRILESGFRFPEDIEGWANLEQVYHPAALRAKRRHSLYDSDRVTWLTESRKRMLYKVQALSRAAGSPPVHRSSSRLATALAFPYNLPIYIARYRWAKRLFGPVPELTVIKFARKIGLTLYRRIRGELPTYHSCGGRS